MLDRIKAERLSVSFCRFLGSASFLVVQCTEDEMNNGLVLVLGKVAAGTFGALFWGLGIVSTWNIIQMQIPECLAALQTMQNQKAIETQLLTKAEILTERHNLKHFLTNEVFAGRMPWKEALESFSWICTQSQMLPADLNLNPQTPTGVEDLMLAFTNWSADANESESSARECQLFDSFAAAKSGIGEISPTIRPETLAAFQSFNQSMDGIPVKSSHP